MKTRRMYFFDTYLYEAEAEVTFIGKDEKGEFIQLDQTIFHPQGGGQPSDAGTINGIPVIKAMALGYGIEDLVNHYMVGAAEHFKVGDKVKLKIDQEKRLQFAAVHTGGHVLANVLRQLKLLSETNLQSVRSHHFLKEAYFSVKPDEGVTVPDAETLKASIIAGVSKILAEQLPITTRIDEAGEKPVRKMRVGEFKEDPCGGTHLTNTGEMQEFSVRNIKISAKEGVKVGYDMAYKPGFFAKSSEQKTSEELKAATTLTS